MIHRGNAATGRDRQRQASGCTPVKAGRPEGGRVQLGVVGEEHAQGGALAGAGEQEAGRDCAGAAATQARPDGSLSSCDHG